MSNDVKIKGLYFYWDKSPETPYLEAISLDENKLINMVPILKERTNNDGEFVIRNVDIFIAQKLDDGLLISKSLIMSEYFINKGSIYAFNSFNNKFVDQALLLIIDNNKQEIINMVNNSDYFKECGISANPVEFDKLYDEGIINA